jgi:RNA polymerase sigma-70 factor, ECF subfamily
LSDPDSDVDLVRRINAGDERAFETLYVRHRDWTVRLAFRFTRNDADALDVLQESFTYLLRKVPRLHLAGRLTTLLYPVVKNLSIAANRKRRRMQIGDLQTGDLPDPAVRSPEFQELSALLQSIPEAQREVLLLRFVHDMQLDEIAQTLEIPLGTVKSRLHNALAALREDPKVRTFFEK